MKRKSVVFFVWMALVSASSYAFPPDSLVKQFHTYVDFKYAANKSRSSVVHIKTYSDQQVNQVSGSMEDFFKDFYGEKKNGQKSRDDKESRLLASGSGVIISSEGLIITNNHIVENSYIIEVILNDKRTYKATLVGMDPTTDIALIKIDAKDLDPIEYGNSDSISVGEWVMAVGNPFNLTSTVTAGIVSAKGRNLNILGGNTQMSIESFIQTDAAVNPGNSGGALVDLNGNLVGINTAIASPTGAYAGYSFAVPVNLVKKVVSDLEKYRAVQRGLLGVLIRDLNADLAVEIGLTNLEGVYVQEVNEKSAAQSAGLKSGDIITSINGVMVNTPAQLQEVVALFRPGDSVSIEFKRNSKIKKVQAVLLGLNGTTQLVPYDPDAVENRIGLKLGELEKDELKMLKADGGVKVLEVGPGKMREAGVQNGFVITHIDKINVHTVNEFNSLMKKSYNKGFVIEGVYPNGEAAFYVIKF
jgi:serine protease Do